MIDDEYKQGEIDSLVRLLRAIPDQSTCEEIVDAVDDSQFISTEVADEVREFVQGDEQ